MKPARVFLPAIVSGALLWTAFFPLDLGPIAFVGLAPFLLLVRASNVSRGRRYFAAFLGGLVFFGLCVKWVRVAHPMMMLFAWPGGATYCALYWPLALFLLRRLDRFGLPLAATTPIVFVAVDYLRTHMPTGLSFLQYVHCHQLIGFGWYSLGYALHDMGPMMQAADLGGVYVLTAAAAGVNGAVHDWLIRVPILRRILRLPPGPLGYRFAKEATITACAVTIPLVLVCYGTVRLAHPPFEPGPRVAAIQGNLSQDEKVIRGDQAAGVDEPPLIREYFPLASRAALPDSGGHRPDLIIWPETCFPTDWVTIAPDPGIAIPPEEKAYADEVRARLGDFTQRRFATANLYGLNSIDWKNGQRFRYNSALLIHKDGTIGGRYDKIHLVPFGEYVPLKEYFPVLQKLTPYDHDYSCTPGESLTRFELPATDKRTFTFGMLICYEDSEPFLARRYNQASGNPPVDFLVNISNDGWFDGTEEHEEHLAVCRFRAVEARRSVVRAVNMGISAVIDPDGRVIATVSAESWAKSKKVPGIVRAEIPIDNRSTVYAALGDWLPGLCWVLVIAGIVARRWVPGAAASSV